jgi:hypothetical protein
MLEHPDEPSAITADAARIPNFITRTVLMAVLSAYEA